MLFTSESVDLFFDNRLKLPALRFVFKGTVTEEDYLRATVAWKEAAQRLEQVKYDLIWDCLQMRDYEMAARRECVRKLQVQSNRIEHVIVISDNYVITSTSEKMLNLFSFDRYFVKSIAELIERHSFLLH